jgi:hypothetical protein
MRKATLTAFAAGTILALVAFKSSDGSEQEWSIKASYIEACSCELFCPCYFNTSPDKDFCKFNNAIKINVGHVGNVKLDGMKIWMAGDLGADFTKGFNSAVVTFEPSATKDQVDAVMTIVPKLYPGKWESAMAAPDRKAIVWEKKGNNGYAKLGDGDGEVTLTGVVGNDGKSLVKINNLTYWGAKKNNGFILAKSKHHFKGQDLDYEFEDANGFFIDIESSGTL